MALRELQSTVALVTGAGSGIGKAAALKLAANGASVGVLGHTRSEIDATVAEIRDAGGAAISLDADVADAAAMRQAVERLVKSFGRSISSSQMPASMVSGRRSTI